MRKSVIFYYVIWSIGVIDAEPKSMFDRVSLKHSDPHTFTVEDMPGLEAADRPHGRRRKNKGNKSNWLDHLNDEGSGTANSEKVDLNALEEQRDSMKKPLDLHKNKCRCSFGIPQDTCSNIKIMTCKYCHHGYYLKPTADELPCIKNPCKYKFLLDKSTGTCRTKQEKFELTSLQAQAQYTLPWTRRLLNNKSREFTALESEFKELHQSILPSVVDLTIKQIEPRSSGFLRTPATIAYDVDIVAENRRDAEDMLRRELGPGKSLLSNLGLSIDSESIVVARSAPYTGSSSLLSTSREMVLFMAVVRVMLY